MTDQTTATIKAKGCTNTGITDDLAEKYYTQLGAHIVAVVELEAHARGDDADGNKRVQFRIKTIEPVVDDPKTEHVVREIARALHGARRNRTEGPTLPLTASDREQTVEEVVAANPNVIPHDYFPTTTGECDACGRDRLDSIHPDEQPDTPVDDDPEPPADEEQPEAQPEPEPEPAAEPEPEQTADDPGQDEPDQGDAVVSDLFQTPRTAGRRTR